MVPTTPGVSARDRIHLAACWAHARRKFREAFKSGQSLAAGPLSAIQRLYQTEAAVRNNRASPEKRMALRQQHGAPVLRILKTDLVVLRQRPEVLPKSPLAKAIDYTLTLWDRLSLYLEDGNIEIDNNLIYAAWQLESRLFQSWVQRPVIEDAA